MAGLGVDNVSVFFLAEGEQPADEVMAADHVHSCGEADSRFRAIYDMRFSDPLKVSLSSAFSGARGSRLKIRFCYDPLNCFRQMSPPGQDPAPSGTGRICAIAGLSVVPHRRNEIDAQQVHSSRWTNRLTGSAKS